jgi:flavin reductase (DIM6/NTAB) family NADH-FMN oxidoreductase RutF
VDEKARKGALLMIPYGLYVIGVADGSTISAFTANFLSQCSFRPPLLMMGVNREGRAHAVLEKGKVFSVNILASDQKEIAAAFFKSPAATGSRFGAYEFETGQTGAPLLLDAPACVECRLVGLYPLGDHSVVVGEVVEAKLRRDAKPLTMEQTGWKYGG